MPEAEPSAVTYETHARGIRILPGQWRPHYAFEQIAWISPPWASQDYLWLDFPEALFANGALYYLSHVNPRYPARFPDLPRIEWRRLPDGLTFERTLPDRLRFGGTITRTDEFTVALDLFIENASGVPLADLRVQTCAYLRALRDFSTYSNDNKFVHRPRAGWTTLTAALNESVEDGTYRVGWRGGRRVADLPVIVCASQDGTRHIAMTWYDQTYNLTGNPNHPCIHADPRFGDLPPGARAQVKGALLFYEGELGAIQDRLGTRR